MKKETLADKLAKKAFYGKDVQNSWAVHAGVFGPILEPAFAEDYQARIHLTAALNHISNRNFQQASAKLKQLQKYCVTDADKALFLFIAGLFCEMAGNQEQMVEMYSGANDFGHRFYLPYLKVARYYMEERKCRLAEENFRGAIERLEEAGENRSILAVAYSNLASCLISMQRYDEAEELLEKSRQTKPDTPNRSMIEAFLWALRGDRDKTEECLSKFEAVPGEDEEKIRRQLEKILAKADPVHFIVPFEKRAVEAFWAWFAEYSLELKQKLDCREYEEGLTPVAEHILEVFPFLEERPYVALGQNEQGYVLVLRTYHFVGIDHAYQVLLECCPEAVKAQWTIVVEE